MRKILFQILFFMTLIPVISKPLKAQNKPGKEILTLKEAVNYGLQHRNSVTKSRLEVAYSRKKTQAAISNYLPQISASTDYRNYLKLPTTILPGVIAGKPGTTIRAKFGQNNNISAGIKAQQVILDPSLISSIQASKVDQDIAKNNVVVEKKNAILQIKQAYFNALTARENWKLSKNSLKQYQELVSISRQQYENKQIQPFDLSEVETQFKNQKQQILLDSLSYLNEIEQLKLEIGFNRDQQISLPDSSIISMARLSTPQNAYRQTASYHVPEFKNIQLQKQLNEKEIQQNNRGYLPKIDAYAFVGSEFFNNQFTPFTSRTWYGSSYVGLNITLSIFSGLQRSYQNQQLHIKRQELSDDAENFMQQFPQRVQIAKRQIDLAIRKAGIQKSKYELANEKLSVQRKRYKLGLINLQEVLNTEVQLNDALNSYVQTLHELINARLKYEKLVARD